MKFYSVLYILIFILFTSGCQHTDQKTPVSKENLESNLKDNLINSNKKRILQEQSQIKDFINKSGLKMIATQTGIYYQVNKEGAGDQVKILSDVELEYKINLLDGTYIYSSDSSGTLKMIVGKSYEPTGLQEALLLLKEGSEAKIIIPSYLAYGLTGDGDKIAGNQTLFYQIKLKKVRNN